jgi:hypothetical protein
MISLINLVNIQLTWPFYILHGKNTVSWIASQFYGSMEYVLLCLLILISMLAISLLRAFLFTFFNIPLSIKTVLQNWLGSLTRNWSRTRICKNIVLKSRPFRRRWLRVNYALLLKYFLIFFSFHNLVKLRNLRYFLPNILIYLSTL